MEFLKKVESKGPLSCDTVLKIFYQTCRAVQHMHRQKPPIIHRDLKVRPRLPCLPHVGPARSARAPLPGSPPVPSWVLSSAGEGLDGRGRNPCVEPRGGDVPWAALGRRAARLLLGTERERFLRGRRAPGRTRRLPFSSWCRQWRGGGFVVMTGFLV